MKKHTIGWDAMQSIREKLYYGTDDIDTMTKGKGAQLTAAECSTVLQILTGDLKIRGGKRGPKVDHYFRDKAIATLSFLYEARGVKPAAAVTDTAKLFGVKRDTVYAARKLHPRDASYAVGWDEKFFNGMIGRLEVEWAWRRKNGET